MAKKNALTPHEIAIQKATRVVDIEAKVKALDTEIDRLKTELRAFVAETGVTDLGLLLAYRRAGAVKIDSLLTDKELEYAKEQLMNELPEFCKRSLDVTKLYNAVRTNAAAANALAAKGITLEQTTDWHFKIVK